MSKKNRNLDQDVDRFFPATMNLSNSRESYITWDKPIIKQIDQTPVTHNTFFELSFQLKRIAVAFLKFALPPRLQAQLDLPNLSISIKRFYDEDFQEYRADIVYEVPFRNNLRKHV
ncbi:MAG: Rpn family recombination-promoting nuclease/putative transposase, partial [Planctomycetaceae bacterium]|nr:Rpn family recombination-promoting nuclease/putative transposase [Planctomycetaceae bacterium]